MCAEENSARPLLDPFNPPLSQRRHWDSFHSAWAEAMARQLNQGLLPPRYFAEANVKVGTRIATDVGTFQENGGAGAGQAQGGAAVWAPPRPVAAVPLNFGDLDLFEVQVLNDEQGPRVVAAVGLVRSVRLTRADPDTDACSPSSAPAIFN